MERFNDNNGGMKSLKISSLSIRRNGRQRCQSQGARDKDNSQHHQ